MGVRRPVHGSVPWGRVEEMLRDESLTGAEIARRLGVSDSLITDRRRRIGICRGAPPWQPPSFAEVLERLGHPRSIRRHRLMSDLGLGRRHAERLLSDWEETGLVKAVGRTRSRRWVVVKQISNTRAMSADDP